MAAGVEQTLERSRQGRWTPNGAELHNRGQRLLAHARTRLIRRSFAAFGEHSVAYGPLRLSGPANMAIGSRVFLGPGCWLEAAPETDRPGEVVLQLGDRVSVSGLTTVSAVRSVVIEDSVLIARGVYISDHSHGIHGDLPIRDQGITGVAPVRVERGAWLGQNAVVLPGVVIGRGAVVGANSVVSRDVPPRTVAVGAPARIVRSLD
ncbi:acyltransferase [Geodermatophilus sp. SYSU D01186]